MPTATTQAQPTSSAPVSQNGNLSWQMPAFTLLWEVWAHCRWERWQLSPSRSHNLKAKIRGTRGRPKVLQCGGRGQRGACARLQPLPKLSSSISHMSSCSHDGKHLARDAARMLCWKCEYLTSPVCHRAHPSARMVLVFWNLWTCELTPRVRRAWKNVWGFFFFFLPSRSTLKCTYFFFSFITMACDFIITSSYSDHAHTKIFYCCQWQASTELCNPLLPQVILNKLPRGWIQKSAPQNEHQTPGCDPLNLCSHLDGPWSWCSPGTASGGLREGTLAALVSVCLEMSFLSYNL